MDHLFGKYGFLAQFAMPNPFGFSADENIYTNKWEIFTTKWFYSDSIEKLEKDAIKWAQENFEELRKTDLMNTNKRKGEQHAT